MFGSLFGLIVKHLPGLPSAVTAFLNPWVWVVVLAASSSSFLFALHIGSERLDDLNKVVQARDDAMKTIVKYVQVQQQVIDKDTVNELQRQNAVLARDNATLLDSLQHYVQAGISFSSDVSSASCGDSATDGVCVSRSKLVDGLRAELQAAVGRSQPSLERGGLTVNLLKACYGFTEKQHTLTSGTQSQ